MDITTISQRSSGVLLHISSLYGPYGIGDLGYQAREFADNLNKSEFSLWQILPLGHTSFGNSPYMCMSAFAGNPWLVSIDMLCEDGLLIADECDVTNDNLRNGKVNYEKVIEFKFNLFRKAFSRFRPDDNYFEFVENNKDWLENYSLFVALKEKFNDLPWYRWPKGLVKRERSVLSEFAECLDNEIIFWNFIQYVFYKQWQSLKNYCNLLGIKIIGDLPIYVAHDSAEVWQNQDLFYLKDDGMPEFVSGVPPDYFSSNGQRWGNPIYKWGKMQDNGFEWWIKRIYQNIKLYDFIRIDHFRGFEAYWEIPADEETAINGRWVKGPGSNIFKALETKFGALPFIAEDLGVITEDVEKLRDEFSFPGMRILQMAFGTDPKADDYIAHNYIKNCVAYTATHDHNTCVGWFNAKANESTTQSEQELVDERIKAREYLGFDNDDEVNWAMIETLMKSNANWVLFPLQDILGLGATSRMNFPGSAEGNWEWRMNFDSCNLELLLRLKEMNIKYGRSKK